MNYWVMCCSKKNQKEETAAWCRIVRVIYNRAIICLKVICCLPLDVIFCKINAECARAEACVRTDSKHCESKATCHSEGKLSKKSKEKKSESKCPTPPKKKKDKTSKCKKLDKKKRSSSATCSEKSSNEKLSKCFQECIDKLEKKSCSDHKKKKENSRECSRTSSSDRSCRTCTIPNDADCPCPAKSDSGRKKRPC